MVVDLRTNVRRTTPFTWEKTRWDTAIIVLLVGCLFLFARNVVRFSVPPFEDAAMLMRYAQHVAEGHGVVWNIGEPPVDGATDFLFMIVTAFLVRIGLSVESAVRSLGAGTHLLTVILVYLAVRYLHRGPILVALTSALYLAIGPGLYYVAAYFGTPFFAFFASLTWCLAWLVVKHPDSVLLALLFSLSGLATGLVRPEGVILAALMLLAIVFLLGWRQSSKAIVAFLLVFSILGGLFFAWRWSYFGHPLPTPFVKKGAGLLYPNSLRESLRNTLILCLPFVPMVILGLRSRPSSRLTVFWLVPIIGFATVFVLLSNDMNFGARFQYAVLPILLISWYAAIPGVEKDFRLPAWASLPTRPRVTLLLLAAVLLVGALGYAYLTSRTTTYGRDGRYDVGRMLGSYADDDLTMATSEAGLLPLYSRWRAVDTWGLNDSWIATRGEITDNYLDRYKPHLIVFHTWFSPPIAPQGSSQWDNMTILLKEYAERHNYILAAAFGSNPYDVHYYYVRPDFPESAEIVDRLQSMDYYYYSTGTKATDYARVEETPG